MLVIYFLFSATFFRRWNVPTAWANEKKGVNANWCWCLFYTKRIFLLIIIICFDCGYEQKRQEYIKRAYTPCGNCHGTYISAKWYKCFSKKNLKFIFPNEYKTTTKHQCIHWGQRFCHCKKTVVLWMKWKKLSFSMDRAKKGKQLVFVKWYDAREQSCSLFLTQIE